MANGIDKKALFNLKSEPYLKPISDLGVGFYNLDENTAILRFQLSNTKGPLLIHENNLTAYAYFESSNGSVSDVIELEIADSLNGIVTITLDKDFLQASTSTKVKGQVYIGVNNVDGNPEYNEVAVFREFTFEVADALINKISSFTKIEYIRMFDQLKARIEQQVQDIEEAIANGADYVAEMQSEREQGVKEINRTVTDGKAYIDNIVDQYKNEVATTKDDAIDDITTTSNNAKTSVNETADGVIKNINNVSGEVTKHVDDKLIEFNGLLETEGFITPEGLGNQLDELEWQKHKITEDNGFITRITEEDVNSEGFLDSLKTGLYFLFKCKDDSNLLTTSNNYVYGYLKVVVSSNSYKELIFTKHNSEGIFRKYKHGDWYEWKELTNFQYDTGWVTFDLINGALSNTAYKGETDGGFDCAYRTITNGSEVTKKLRINGTNLTPNQVIAQLPSNFAKNAQAFPVRVPNSSAGGYVVIRPSGRVNFYVSGDSSNWTETGYAYGECTWHD